jgi:cell division protein FtsX
VSVRCWQRCLTLIAAAAATLATAAPTDDEIKATYRQILPLVDSAKVQQTYRDIASFGSRLAGSAGEAKTFDYVESKLKGMGAANIVREPFSVTVPNPDATGTLNVNGQSITVYPMWPNLVRPSSCDLSGPLLYAGKGGYDAIKGKPVEGRIVVLDFDCGSRWKIMAKLGAKAILFLPPDNPNRTQAEQKFSTVPINVPRFYLPLTHAGTVLAAAAKSGTASLKCAQDWQRKTSYNLIAEFPGSDPKLAQQPIALMAYADSMSVVPGLAPGAEAISGPASLLELARIYRLRPGARPLRVILSGAHGLALKGAKEFVQTRLDSGKGNPFLTITLDFTSGASTVGSFARGWAYDYRDEPLERVKSVSRLLRSHTDRLAAVLGVSPARLVFIDAANNGDGRTWKNNISGKFALDAEPMILAGMNALTFTTTEDSRPRVDTPFDTLDRVDFGNVKRQLQTTACLLHHVYNDPADFNEQSDHKIPLKADAPRSMSLVGGFAKLYGQVVSFDPTRSFIPDTPVEGTLASLNGRQTSMMGVRGDQVQLTEPKTAAYRFIGVPTVNSYWVWNEPPITRLSAFRIQPGKSTIDYAASLGVYGDERYPIFFNLKTDDRESPIVVFPCVAVDIYDLVDPAGLDVLQRLRILDAVSGTYPTDFGQIIPPFDQKYNPEVEDSSVMFFTPGQRFSVLGGRFETRMILVNSSVNDEKGLGYLAPGGKVPPGPAGEGRALIARDGRFPDTSLNTARDITAINQTRLDRFFKYRIISPGIKQLHQSAVAEIKAAEEAQSKMDWGEAQRHARAAWGYALKAHPVIMATANDVVNGVVFYLFLLLPFSYFVERLFIGHQLLIRQLGWSIAIFISSFILLRLIHPAFEIVQNPTMIFVAFVMGVLALIVISFILGKFDASLRDLRQAQTGTHSVDIKRGSVAMAAFNLGVSNMRRRKARTFLTTLTLVVMTFIVLSFTSIVSDLQLNETPSDHKAAYAGMLIRTPGLDPLEQTTYRTVANEFDGKGVVVRRGYYYGADIGDTGVLTLQRADRVAEVRTMLGLEPDEAKVTHPDQALLKGGRWFRPGDKNVMILPSPLAEQLKVDPKDVGTAQVTYAGVPYTVIGIVDPGILRSLEDLDGDGIMPPDFSLSRRYQESTQSSNAAFRSYLRIDPANVFILPADTALSLGADTRNLAVRFDDPNQTRKSLDELMPRLRLNMYASVPNKAGELEVKQFSVIQGSKTGGLALILVQLAIASVFVLNTMIASVYERTKEIGIFSAIGLAPNHISMLFFAESLVYGILGAVAGYFVAQGTAKFIVATGSFPGLTLNFSSTSAVLSAGIVMGIVVLSTLYPARRAAQIAAPAMNDEVFQTEPDGDVWVLPLPFSISEGEAAPLTAFLGEWLKAYEGYTIGEFVSKDAEFGLAVAGDRPSFYVSAITWLAPYDLGISQYMRLDLKPGMVRGVYVLDLTLTRIAGDPENWPIVNQRFLANLRLQFLTWRTLERSQRERYRIESDSFTVAAPSSEGPTGASPNPSPNPA